MAVNDDQIPDILNDDPIEIVAWVFGVTADEMQTILDEEETRNAPIDESTNEQTEPAPATAEYIASAKALLDAGTITQSDYNRIAGVPAVALTRAESAALLLESGTISQAEHDKLVAFA